MSGSEHGAAVGRGARPMSPHLQVYRLPLTAVMSILHRVTGCALMGGGVALVWWLVAAASGEGAFDFINWLLTSWVGGLGMLVFGAALMYHLCNGIRHLVWDAGYGYEKLEVAASNKAVLGAAAILTAILSLYAWLT